MFIRFVARLAGNLQRSRAVRFIVIVAMLGDLGCGDVCSSRERELPASGRIGHALFIEEEMSLDVATVESGEIVRSTCEGNVLVFDRDFAPRRRIGVDYELRDQRWIESVAMDPDGNIAAITFELEWLGDIDEQTYTRLVLFGPDGTRRWSIVLAENDLGTDYRVAIGPDHVFVADSGVSAYAKETGLPVWGKGYSPTTYDASIAPDSDGGVIASTPTVLEHIDAAGTVLWSLTPEALGFAAFDQVASAGDGSIAVVGNDGGLSSYSMQYIAMLEPDGERRWSHPLGSRYGNQVSSLATDGEQIFAAGDYAGRLSFDLEAPEARASDGFLAAVGPGGVESVFTTRGHGTEYLTIIGLTEDTAILEATVFENEQSPDFVIEGTEADGQGSAIFTLAR